MRRFTPRDGTFLSSISNILPAERNLPSVDPKFSLNDPEAYEAICKRRAPADAGLR
jgi:hypothetical protein